MGVCGKKGGSTPFPYIWRSYPASRGIHPMLFQCWASVEDGEPTLKQYWVNISCLLGLTFWVCSSDATLWCVLCLNLTNNLTWFSAPWLADLAIWTNQEVKMWSNLFVNSIQVSDHFSLSVGVLHWSVNSLCCEDLQNPGIRTYKFVCKSKIKIYSY